MEPDETAAPWNRHPDLVDPPVWTPGARVASWVWALVPFFTLGLANPAVFIYSAIRKKEWGWWWVAFGYIAISVGMYSLTGSPDGSLEDIAFGVLVLVNWVVGTGHALGVRRRVFEPGAVTDLTNDPVLAKAVDAKERRELARQILAQDPQLASDLAIGRPDINRGYDDGGLIDMNSAPLDVLVRVPGITPPMAERIVAARTATSGFTSLEEMTVLADLPPSFVDAARDHLVLSPR